VFVAFIGFIVAGLVGPIMAALGALWTGWALKAEA
jgi:hypothetical protein